MHHQSYNAHRYLPATSAALAYRAAYFPREQQQLWKLSSFCWLQGTGDEFAQRTLASDLEGMRRGGGEEEGRGEGEDSMESGPTKAEYLSSGGVLFTYFQGTIGAEVDEHFSRALRVGGAAPSAQQCGSSYPAHPFSPGSSLCLSLHPELSPSCKIQGPEPALSGSITQAPDSWHHTSGTQSGTVHQHVHEMHPHVHSHRVHPHVHARHFFSPTEQIHFSARIGGHI